MKTWFPPGAIRAELSGSDRCAALGITAVGYAPVTMLARKLIRAGVDPAARSRSIAAPPWRCGPAPWLRPLRVTVRDDNRGVPRFVGYRAPRAARPRQRLSEASGLPE